MGRRLFRDFYRRPPETVAQDLLGRTLVRRVGKQRVSGTIVETEAYLGIPDRAAHTFGGRCTARNASMWADGGTVYVYFTYGLHHCVNVVAGLAGDPVAVLLRALAPQEGVDLMQSRRGKNVDLCSGPARLCQALAIDRTLDGSDLVSGREIFIEEGMADYDRGKIVRAPRVGVAYAGAWARRLLRYYLKDDPNVSRR